MKCPICESNGTLHEIIATVTAHPLPSVSIEVPLQFLQCSYCHEEIEIPGNLEKNDAAIRQAKMKWLAENIEKKECIPAILKELRSLLGVTQREFSDLIGATGNSVSKYELGTITPTSMAKKFIALLAVQPNNFETLKSIHKHQQPITCEIHKLPQRAVMGRYTLEIGREIALAALGWPAVTVTTIEHTLPRLHVFSEHMTSTNADAGYVSLAMEWEGSIDIAEDGDTASSFPPTYPGFFNPCSRMN